MTGQQEAASLVHTSIKYTQTRAHVTEAIVAMACQCQVYWRGRTCDPGARAPCGAASADQSTHSTQRPSYMPAYAGRMCWVQPGVGGQPWPHARCCPSPQEHLPGGAPTLQTPCLLLQLWLKEGVRWSAHQSGSMAAWTRAVNSYAGSSAPAQQGGRKIWAKPRLATRVQR